MTIPFAGYENWDACIADQIEKGNNQQAAERICGALQDETEGKSMRRLTATKPTCETRDDGTRVITGYAAVFYREDDPGTEFEILPGFFERLDPGFFDEVFAQGLETRGMYNHRQLLAKFPRTMKLSTDATGLRYEIDVPDTSVGRDLVVHLERGDIQGSSFSFDVAEDGQRMLIEGKKQVRMLTNARSLGDVGPVDFPAYEATTAEIRSACQADLDKWRCDLKSKMQKRVAALDV